MPKLPLFPGGDKKFYELLECEASNLKDTAFSLAEMVKNYDYLEDRATKINDLEHKGDDIIHQIMSQLHKTFVTPLDRGDIVKLARRLAPNIITVDISPPDMSGLELARRLNREIPQAKVVMVAMHEEQRYREEAVKAGAASCVTKGHLIDELPPSLNHLVDQGLARDGEQLGLGLPQPL
ncbi:MAG: DUF47 family protein [Dehalococcoidia bacterium]